MVGVNGLLRAPCSSPPNQDGAYTGMKENTVMLEIFISSIVVQTNKPSLRTLRGSGGSQRMGAGGHWGSRGQATGLDVREPQRWGGGSSRRRSRHNRSKTAFKGEVWHKGELEGFYEYYQEMSIRSKRHRRGEVSPG